MSTYDVVGIGNALVDVMVRVDDGVLEEFSLSKSVMHLVSARESESILQRLRDYNVKIVAGGSIANSLVGLAALGNQTAFIGSVGTDQFAETFEKDLKLYGVEPHLRGDTKHATGHSIIFNTPDGERTFATHVGASAYLSPDNINPRVVEAAQILYIEGYVLAQKEARRAARHAAQIARKRGVKIALDMSNISVVREHRGHLQEMIEEYANIIFANKDEAHAYTGEEPEEALAQLSELAEIVIITRHDEGSLIQSEGQVYTIDPVRADVVSTNGAGDMYAAGILHGIVNELPFDEAGKIASFFAAKVVEIEAARLPHGYVQAELKKALST